MLIYTGKISGKRISEYQGKRKVVLQFLQQGFGESLSIFEVKVPDTIDHEPFTKGRMAVLPLAFSVLDNRVYFRVDADTFQRSDFQKTTEALMSSKAA